MTAADEIRALAAFLGLDRARVDQALRDLEGLLATYAEVVLTGGGLEVITGGRGREAAARLAETARRHGAPAVALGAFESGVAAYPDRMAGLKLSLGPTAAGPSLYLRTLCPLGEGLDFLRSLPDAAPAAPALRRILGRSRTLYGLGFFGSRFGLGVKTYTVVDVAADPVLGPGRRVPGFLSHRVEGGRLTGRFRRYVPEVPFERLSALPRDLAPAVKYAAGTLGYAAAGHVALGPGGVKVYVERKGAIPTDFSAR